MKPTLQTRLFLRLSGWLALILFVLFAAMASHEVVELLDHKEAAKEELLEILMIFGITLFFFVIISMALVGVLSNRVLKPLRRIADTATEIEQGALHERIPEPLPDDEIGAVARALNQAFDRYTSTVQRMEQFTSDASHQLRTPLTALRTSGEVALGKERTAGEYRETIAAMLDEVQRLTTIVEQLLALSRLESVELERGFSAVNMDEVIRDTVERYRALADARGICIDLTGIGDGHVRGDHELLGEALANLLDNALQASPDQGRVRVTLADGTNGNLAVSVLDDGPGIPEAMQRRIFDRFCRLPRSRHAGSGLGLAIVTDIVALHRGNVYLDPSVTGGACFTIQLPRATDRDRLVKGS